MNSASPPPDSADSGAEGISKSPDDSPLEDAPSIDRPPGSVTRINLERRREGHPPRGRDVVATEEPLEVRIRYAKGEDLIERAVAVTMRTPGDDFDLATGFLYSEGVVESAAEIAEISHCTDRQNPQLFNIVTVTLRPGVSFNPTTIERNFYTTSSCGVCGKATLEALQLRGQKPIDSKLQIPESLLRKLPDALRREQPLFEKTGGIHASGLFDRSGRIEVLREDVGRHNALDKVIGALLMRDELPAKEQILVVSGRASFELVQKAIRAGIPIIAAVGAPSSLAIGTAEEFGATLLGFTGPQGFNIYCGAERIC